MVSILPHGGGRAGYPPGTRSCRACAEVLRAIVPACSPLMRSCAEPVTELHQTATRRPEPLRVALAARRPTGADARDPAPRSEEHTSELQSQSNLVCRLL